MDGDYDSGKEARLIIKSRWPAMYTRMEAADTKAGLVPQIQLDKSGKVPTLCVGDIRLASAWAPEKEALLQVSGIPPSSQQVTLFGIGMGYLPPTLLQRLPAEGVLTVVPLNLSLFARLLELIDMTDWLSDERVEFRQADSYKKLPVNSVVTPPLLQFAEQSAEHIRDWLLQKLSESHAYNYQRSHQNTIEENISYHLEHHQHDEDVGVLLSRNSAGGDADSSAGAGTLDVATQSVRNRSVSKTVVIGAGPSLDQSASAIKDLQADGACTIAVDAALISLMNKGIIPDYVVCIDPLDYVARLFNVDHNNLTDTCLIYFPTANRTVVSAWKNKRYTAIGSHSRFDRFNKARPSTVLFSSGSVIHPAVDLAVRAGADNVYLAGADFGFPANLTHAQDSPFAADRQSIYVDGQTVRNYRDQEMASQINFISYFRDLEYYIEQQSRRGVSFHNLGHDSAKIKHVSCIPLAA